MALETNESRKSERPIWPLRIGYFISAIWIVGFSAYAYISADEIVKLAPNNLGDFVAGMFAPLAFLWLFVATLLQKSELIAQREELVLNREVLSLQAEELHNSVEQLRTQAQVLEKQFATQRKQKALAEIQDGVHGICAIIIGKFADDGMSTATDGTLSMAAWFSKKGLTDLLDNENHSFLLDEIINRMLRGNKHVHGQIEKFPKILIRKIPSLSEMDAVVLYIQRTLDIPRTEESLDLQSKFQLEYPLPKLLVALVEMKTICVNNGLAPL